MGETPIDAVEMVREIRDAMFEETRGMTDPEYLAYLAKKAAELRAAEERRPDSGVGGRSAA
jgi:hypothetical protein